MLIFQKLNFEGSRNVKQTNLVQIFRVYERFQNLWFYDSPFKRFDSLTTIQSPYLPNVIILKCEDGVLTGGPEK